MMLGGRYEVLDTVFTRGAVRIVRAVDVKDQLPVVIRTMQVSGENMEAFVRFQEEAALITSLDHPNIWKVYGTFIDQGMSCVVVEAVEGRTLGDLLRRGRLPLERTKHISLQIAGALAYGHQRNIIHRNLEPENVVITNGDIVKLRDMAELGMARLVRGAAVPMPSMTARADLYASPEQRQGQTVGPQTEL